MSSSIHNLIKAEYERKRLNAEKKLDEKKAALYTAIPRLREIEDEINRAGLSFNMKILAGAMSPGEAAARLSETTERLRAERKELLAANGYPENYLEPEYECNKCLDTGIVTSADGAGAFCACYRQRLIDYIYEMSNLAFLDNNGFESFRPDYYPDVEDESRYGIKKSPRRQILGILENCRAFVRNFSDSRTRNMLFCGPTGVGKTFMACCIATELMNSGHTVLYQTAPSLFNSIYEYRYKSSRDEAEDDTFYKNIFDVELLIIDDLGTEPPTAMRYAELLNIIDTRCANDRRKPCKTIIATNIDLKQLFEYYDERIISRITGGFDIYRFAGDDIRSLKKQEVKKGN